MTLRWPDRLLPRSLSWRLAGALSLTIVVAMAISAGLGAWRAAGDYAVSRRDQLVQLADVFGRGGARALVEDDEGRAGALMRAIGKGDLVYAALRRPDGSVLADQGVGVRLANDLDLIREPDASPLRVLLTHTVRVETPVLEQGDTVGSVLLIAETRDLKDGLKKLLWTTLQSGLAALAVGLLLVLGLRRTVTRPLSELALTMEEVRRDRDYARRARIASTDEVGSLATTFNALLDAVAERDQRLVAHRDSLEQEVGERTRDLVTARDAAERANAAKSTFLATMSHEIRTPLNGLLVMAELLAGDQLPARSRRFASVILQSGQTLLSVINDILDLAKVEAGKIELEDIAFEARPVVETVATLFAERARAKGIDIASLVSPDVPARLLGDPVRLGQIVGNLVNNAVKFTEAGSVRVIVETVAGDTLRISVADTGPGIPDNKQAAIFEAFSQADASTTRQHGGTGLGLSIAVRLAEAMGGRISLESTVGVGSTFTLTIPLRPAPAMDTAARAPAPAVKPFGYRLAGLGPATSAVLASVLARHGGAAVHDDATSAALIFATPDVLDEAIRHASPGGNIVLVAAAGDPRGEALVATRRAHAVLRWPVAEADLLLLLERAAAGLPLQAETAGAAGPARTASFAGGRVLVADDSAINREVAGEALRQLGVTDILFAVDGREAVEAALARNPDVVLMDGSMPVIDGFGATRLLRDVEQREGRSHIPVIALTAHVVGDAAEAWREAGMDDVLHKPFTLEALARVLKAYLPAAEALAEEPLSGALAQLATPAQPARPAAPEPEAPASGLPLLDESVVESLLAMGETAGTGFLARLARTFRDQALPALSVLREAVLARDPAALAHAAHALRSMALNLGSLRLARTLSRIEQDALERGTCPEPDGLGELMADLAATLDAFEARLSPEPDDAAETCQAQAAN